MSKNQRIAREHMYLYSAAMVTTCGLAAAQLQNPDFEQKDASGNLANWTVSTGKLVADNRIKSAGQYAGKLDGGEAAAAIYQDVPVEPGKAYVFSGVWRNGDKTADFDIVSATISYLEQ